MPHPSPPAKTDCIIIVGAGVFGLTTALELAARGYSNVSVLDRFVPPVVDGSSVDLSRIIRFDYGDTQYGVMAREAVAGWAAAEHAAHYHQCGFVMLNEGAGGFAYTRRCLDVDAALGRTIEAYPDAAALRARVPCMPAKLDGLSAFYNPKGGWADAAASIAQLAGRCSQAGVSLVCGRRGTVHRLVYEDGPRVAGVQLLDGSRMRASLVVLAAGAWTNHLLRVTHASSASAHPVGCIQLTADEAATLRDMPVMIHSNKGVFVFPPTPGTNILKVARHGYGYATAETVDDGRAPPTVLSCPRRDGKNARNSFMPDDAQQGLRDGLRDLVPEFAERPWSRLRLCWYSDTPEGDFIVDNHPQIAGLFLATGGSGHGFKFLPVLGRYIVDCLENKAPESLRYKWRMRPESDSKL
ncbi:fructosyl amino acid oxidase [Cordyceps militaris]|uniref:Fructosyl amino acid oxidase n=1 Tax=Cordyceps militaris TaxID=73501 RepID=A0A2H4S7P6_CORMI|nr:fructosyl amino acid oxidase [Cordyceps militaris]